MALVRIQKARQKARRTGSQASAYRTAQRHFKPFVRAFQTHADDLKATIDQRALTAALANGDVGAASRTVAYHETADDIRVGSQVFEAQYRSAVQEAGAKEMNRLRLDMNFTLDNPYSEQAIRDRGARLVTRVSADTKAAIAAAVLEGFQQGNPPAVMARTIRESVGLLPRQARAVQRRLRLHIDRGMDPALAAQRAERYAAQLLRQRAEMIARTETIDAEAQGISDSWQMAEDEGLMVPGTKKRWLAAPSARTCEICGALHRSDPIPLNESWTVEGVGYDRPPAHPNCRCSMGLVIP